MQLKVLSWSNTVPKTPQQKELKVHGRRELVKLEHRDATHPTVEIDYETWKSTDAQRQSIKVIAREIITTVASPVCCDLL